MEKFRFNLITPINCQLNFAKSMQKHHYNCDGDKMCNICPLREYKDEYNCQGYHTHFKKKKSIIDAFIETFDQPAPYLKFKLNKDVSLELQIENAELIKIQDYQCIRVYRCDVCPLKKYHDGFNCGSGMRLPEENNIKRKTLVDTFLNIYAPQSKNYLSEKELSNKIINDLGKNNKALSEKFETYLKEIKDLELKVAQLTHDKEVLTEIKESLKMECKSLENDKIGQKDIIKTLTLEVDELSHDKKVIGEAREMFRKQYSDGCKLVTDLTLKNLELEETIKSFNNKKDSAIKDAPTCDTCSNYRVKATEIEPYTLRLEIDETRWRRDLDFFFEDSDKVKYRIGYIDGNGQVYMKYERFDQNYKIWEEHGSKFDETPVVWKGSKYVLGQTCLRYVSQYHLYLINKTLPDRGFIFDFTKQTPCDGCHDSNIRRDPENTPIIL